MNAVTKYFTDIYGAISTVLVGMATSGRAAFRKPVTLEYPDVKWQLPDRYRGILFNKIEDCIGCLACARVCPVNCIHIQVVKRAKEDAGQASDGTKILQWVTQFDIDMSLCMLCGLCTEPCPTHCLVTTKEYERAVHSRKGMYFEFATQHDIEMGAKAKAAKEAEAAAKAAAAAAKKAEAEKKAEKEAETEGTAPESDSGDQ